MAKLDRYICMNIEIDMCVCIMYVHVCVTYDNLFYHTAKSFFTGIKFINVLKSTIFIFISETQHFTFVIRKLIAAFYK